MEKREPLCTVGGTVNWSGHYGKQYRNSSKKKKRKRKRKLPCDLAIPLLDIFLKELKSAS